MSTTLIDGHVHLHENFRLDRVLESAVRNAARLTPGADAENEKRIVVLLLAQIPASDPLEDLKQRAALCSTWTHVVPDDTSMVFTKPDGSTVVVVAGRQLVSAEKLEVLGLCSRSEIPNGLPLGDAVTAVRDAGAVAVLPWGFGKWWFSRGQLLRQFLATEKVDDASVLLGENGCHWASTGEAAAKLGRQYGVPVLAGSDPLPIPVHEQRAGSFGSLIRAAIDLDMPTEWLRGHLRNPTEPLETVGRGRTLLEFVRDQVGVRTSGKKQ